MRFTDTLITFLVEEIQLEIALGEAVIHRKHEFGHPVEKGQFFYFLRVKQLCELSSANETSSIRIQSFFHFCL